MKAEIKLGRIAGIEIGLHYSWFIIALLITLSLVGEFRALNPEWGEGVIWTTAIATILLFGVRRPGGALAQPQRSQPLLVEDL